MTTSSRDRMIRATARLLRRQGYHGTGLNQIVSEAEAPKGSLYFHFPGGKAQLAAEAIDAFADGVHRTIRQLTVETGSQAGGLAAYLDLAADRFDEVGFDAGCAIATVSAEAAPTEPALAEATGRALRAWTEALAAGLVAEGHAPERATVLATSGVALIEGAIVMARGIGSSEPLRQVRAVLADLVAAPATAGPDAPARTTGGDVPATADRDGCSFRQSDRPTPERVATSMITDGSVSPP